MDEQEVRNKVPATEPGMGRDFPLSLLSEMNRAQCQGRC
jgi:hypothetical protein